MKDAFFQIDNNIHATPFATQTGVVDWSLWRAFVAAALKTPETRFTGPLGLEGVLAALYNGDHNITGSPMTYNQSELENENLRDPSTGLTNGYENFEIISCMDHDPYSFKDVRELQPYFESKNLTDLRLFVQGLSPFAGLMCLNVTAVERFNGTFKAVKPSCPILFLNNILDPVTPLHDAVSSASGFEGSSVPISNSTGHASLLAPNLCLVDAVTQYLKNGTLPANGTICQPEILPFALLPDGTPANVTGSEESLRSKSKQSLAWPQLW
ncbi:MAG: hypothetical protein M1816_004315 [Peltula sp. TS41687]|nr:MAG: hypothetical protein M1816_004315 [Peltula sp. TS41687]